MNLLFGALFLLSVLQAHDGLPDYVTVFPASQENHIIMNIPNTEEYIELDKQFAKDALEIASKCENKTLNPRLTHRNSNGSIDRGILQLNSIHDEEMRKLGLDPNKEYDRWIYIRDVLHARQGWRPWSCRHVLGHR
jgi:hypothetical protein